MATIVKTPEGTYRVRVRRKGQNVSANFPTRQDAVDWGQKTEAALIEKRYFPERTKYTLGDAIDRYIKEVIPYIKPSTAEKQRFILQWWKRKIGPTPQPC
jgi:hypothetical protein